jgi:hypothetical protein
MMGISGYRRNVKDQQIYEKMLNLISQTRNVNQSYNEIPPHPRSDGCYLKHKRTHTHTHTHKNAGEDVEKRELYTQKVGM